MSTLSQGIYEEGIRVGKLEGINIGKTEGINIGKTEGIKEGMLSAILRLINNGMSFEEVVKILKLSKDEQNDFKSKIHK